jgi:(2Fe-2S) ferredoxin
MIQGLLVSDPRRALAMKDAATLQPMTLYFSGCWYRRRDPAIARALVDWAMEGHRLAAEHAYQLPRSGKIGEAYEQANLPLVDLALIEAGVRLAKVLNEALGNYHAAPAAQPSAASAPGTYPDREAAAHVGEVATVVGTVVTVHRSNSGNIYLNFGANYPNQTFSAAILNPRDPKLLNLDSLTGKRVSVKGLIKLYKGKAEIVVESAGQIEVRE